MNKCKAAWSGGKCSRTDIAGDGLCFGHYQQLQRNTPLRKIRFYRPIGMNLKQLSSWCLNHGTRKQGDCMEWVFACSPYAVIRIPDKQLRVHRMVMEQLVLGRKLKINEVVHHKCSNKKCINPKHLGITNAVANLAEGSERKIYRMKIKKLEKTVLSLKRRLFRLTCRPI